MKAHMGHAVDGLDTIDRQNRFHECLFVHLPWLSEGIPAHGLYTIDSQIAFMNVFLYFAVV